MDDPHEGTHELDHLKRVQLLGDHCDNHKGSRYLVITM